MPKMKKVLFSYSSLLFLYSLSIFSLLPLLLFYWSSTAHLLFIYCYYSIRTIYFKLNDSFYTREGAEIY